MRIAFLGNFAVPYSSESHHAATLEMLGHEVIRLQEPHVPAGDIIEAVADAELFVWVHTHGWSTPGDITRVLKFCRRQRIPSMTYHLDLWMGLRRERDMRTDPYWDIDHFFTVDRLMAEYLNGHTPVHGHYMPAAIFAPEAYIAYDDPHPYANDVIFVGQKNYHPEWPYRPQVVNWLEAAYGDRFTRIAGDTPAGTTRGHDLNRLYASSKVVVGDSLCLSFDYPDYWSDRVYETVGRGGFLIHPHVPGMEDHFTDRTDLVFYNFGDFDQLRALIDHYLDEDEARNDIRTMGQAHVKSRHTYAHRWTEILATVFA